MSRPTDGDPLVELDPPMSSVTRSAEFLAQSLEILFVCLRSGEAHHLRPIHAESLHLGWPPNARPGEVVVEAAARYGLDPLLVHSTSWRHEDGELVITYVAVVAPPAERSHYLAEEPVRRSDLARGDAFGPPPEIGLAQVVEHALRHLAWLVADDPVVGTTLAEWKTFLNGYEPEPFRAFGDPA
jgi:hypothetical protein